MIESKTRKERSCPTCSFSRALRVVLGTEGSDPSQRAGRYVPRFESFLRRASRSTGQRISSKKRSEDSLPPERTSTYRSILFDRTREISIRTGKGFDPSRNPDARFRGTRAGGKRDDDGKYRCDDRIVSVSRIFPWRRNTNVREILLWMEQPSLVGGSFLLELPFSPAGPIQGTIHPDRVPATFEFRSELSTHLHGSSSAGSTTTE